MARVVANARKSKSAFVSAVVKDNTIISISQSNGDKNPLEHAEILAIKKVLKRMNPESMKKCILYSTCEPCLMCMGAIHWAGIKEVAYGARLEDSKRFGFNEILVPQLEKVLKASGIKFNKDIMRKECLELFNQI